MQIRVHMSTVERWCSVLERHRSAEEPEVLRMACAESLCLVGAPLLSHSLREHSTPAVMIRCKIS